MTGIITIVVGLVLAITTWNFAATNGAVQKKDHDKIHDKLDHKVDDIQQGIEDIKDLILELHMKGRGEED
jgi:sensor domain CHASE-containing protein